MTQRKPTNDDTMDRLRSDPWFEAFVASRRRHPFAQQRTRNLTELLAERGAVGVAGRREDHGNEPDGAADEDEILCGRSTARCSSSDGERD